VNVRGPRLAKKSATEKKDTSVLQKSTKITTEIVIFFDQQKSELKNFEFQF
jgi:hypothetical protein